MDLEDRSQPEKAKEDLTNYYKRRENQLQHQKYRILHRWAHYALVSKFINSNKNSLFLVIRKMRQNGPRNEFLSEQITNGERTVY